MTSITMKRWKKLTPKEKELFYSAWETTAGEDWDENYSQLKVDELFDTLGGKDLLLNISKKKDRRKLRKVM